MYYEQEDVLDYLLSICKKKHIKCFWPSSLDPHTPPTALPSKRRIVMNPTFYGFSFNPLDELVDCYKQMCEDTLPIRRGPTISKPHTEMTR